MSLLNLEKAVERIRNEKKETTSIAQTAVFVFHEESCEIVRRQRTSLRFRNRTIQSHSRRDKEIETS